MVAKARGVGWSIEKEVKGLMGDSIIIRSRVESGQRRDRDRGSQPRRAGVDDGRLGDRVVVGGIVDSTQDRGYQRDRKQ